MRKVFLLLSLFLAMASSAQNRTTPYEFPVKPGTAEWKKFQSRSEMGDALQIPPAILKNLTTEALAKTCLNYPMFKDLYFFNTIQTGFDGLRQSFNGFPELLNRRDAGAELLKLYKQLSPAGVNRVLNDTLKGDFVFQFVQIEILLAQDQVIRALPAAIEGDLLKEAALKYELKKTIPAFSSFSLSPSILVIGRILDKNNRLQDMKTEAAKDGIQNFLATGFTADPAILDRIWLAVKK